MDKEKLLKELREKFEETKKELGFQASFEELDKSFFLENEVLKEGYVLNFYEPQLRNRILDSFASWIGTLHSYIMPNPQDLVLLSEMKRLDENEKKEASHLISLSMDLLREGSIASLTNNNKRKAELIDKCLKLWNEEFVPKLVKILEKAQTTWKDEKIC
jgi:hypothetical protein